MDCDGPLLTSLLLLRADGVPGAIARELNIIAGRLLTDLHEQPERKGGRERRVSTRLLAPLLPELKAVQCSFVPRTSPPERGKQRPGNEAKSS